MSERVSEKKKREKEKERERLSKKRDVCNSTKREREVVKKKRRMQFNNNLHEKIHLHGNVHQSRYLSD